MSSVKRVGTRAKLRVETARSHYGWLDVAITTFKRHSEKDGGFFAAGLTYYAFFSLFPLILFSVSALGFVTFISEQTQQRIIDAGVDAFPLVRRILQEDSLRVIQEARFSLASAGLLLALYSGTGGIVAFRHALNRIYGVEDEGTFLRKRISSLRFLATIGGIALLSVALGTLGGLIASSVVTLLAYLAGFGIGVLLFAGAFKFLPRRELSWREVLPGAIVAAAIFELLKIVGPLYLAAGAEGRNATYGAFATAAALLVSAYLLCQVTLLAAQLNAVLAERRQTREFSLSDQDKEGS